MTTDEIRSLVAATRAVAKAERERDKARAEVGRLTALLGSHADGHRCTCMMTDLGVYYGDNMHPPEWEQDPWCPTHPDMDYVRAAKAALERVEALHAQRVRCGSPSHTNPTFACPSCEATCAHCGEEYPCPTIEALGDAP